MRDGVGRAARAQVAVGPDQRRRPFRQLPGLRREGLQRGALPRVERDQRASAVVPCRRCPATSRHQVGAASARSAAGTIGEVAPAEEALAGVLDLPLDPGLVFRARHPRRVDEAAVVAASSP